MIVINSSSSFDFSLITKSLPTLLEFLPITLEILVFSTIFGILLGVLIALIKLLKIPVLSQLATVYISFIRGTPILIQLFIVYYGLPIILENLFAINISRMDPFNFVIIAYSLSHGAIFAEVFRSAIQTVDAGQTEAALALGMSPGKIFVRIIFPQALRVAFPNIANIVIGSLKDTSLAFTIGVMDMMGRGEALISATTHAIEVYISLAIIYYVIVVILEKAFKIYERHLGRYTNATEHSN